MRHSRIVVLSLSCPFIKVCSLKRNGFPSWSLITYPVKHVGSSAQAQARLMQPVWPLFLDIYYGYMITT